MSDSDGDDPFDGVAKRAPQDSDEEDVLVAPRRGRGKGLSMGGRGRAEEDDGEGGSGEEDGEAGKPPSCVSARLSTFLP